MFVSHKVAVMHLNRFVGFSRYLLLPYQLFSHTQSLDGIHYLYEVAPRCADIVADLFTVSHSSRDFTAESLMQPKRFGLEFVIGQK